MVWKVRLQSKVCMHQSLCPRETQACQLGDGYTAKEHERQCTRATAWSCMGAGESNKHVQRGSIFAQLPLLRSRWKSILLGAVFQYVHAMSTQLAHRMHRPMVEPLHDIGFDMLPVRAARQSVTHNPCDQPVRDKLC